MPLQGYNSSSPGDRSSGLTGTVEFVWYDPNRALPAASWFVSAPQFRGRLRSFACSWPRGQIPTVRYAEGRRVRATMPPRCFWRWSVATLRLHECFWKAGKGISCTVSWFMYEYRTPYVSRRVPAAMA